ncbi:hypothetical protein [Streptomyces sp. NPDC001652]|uniref:hypothetical protein n=1 Tax=Streptomyces sp. NPDC001652 TaxID=3154393 RepID=UPI0033262BDB
MTSLSGQSVLHVAGRRLPGPASVEDVAAFERVVGHPMPELLKRISLEVANGGFRPWEVVSVTKTDDWFSGCSDITMAYVPLIDRGCAMWTLIDFRTADGQMRDWDPNLCCVGHAPAPTGQSLAQWLTAWLQGTAHQGPYPERASIASDCRNS